MRAPVWAVLGCVLGGGCVRDALLSLTPGVDEFPGSPSEVPRDSALGREIAEGYRLYGVALATSGAWSTDATYGVRWCPAPAAKPFVPFVTAGHWAPVETVPSPHAASPPDAPYWVADPNVAGGDITMHHGWWVNGPGAPGRWCWVPGTTDTPARVLWRENDGFVAWAAEPPSDEEDASADDDLLAWVYEFEGTLYEDAIDLFLLRDDAADAAESATRRGRSADRGAGRGSRRYGPLRHDVTAARSALSDYTVAHPGVAPHPASGASPHVAGPVGAGVSTPLPPARAIFSKMARDPVYEGGHSRASLPAVPASGGGHSSSINSYAGHAGASGGDCGSHSGGHSSSSHSESHPSGQSAAGRVGGGSGGDCGSHSTHHK